MFDFGHSNYMQHAFPLDELDPVHCTGRGVDRDNPENFNVNDVLGNYSLGLIDSLDTIALMGDRDRFVHAVDQTIRTVSFDQDSTVQVFEVTIRVMGGLLSAHLIAKSGEFGMRIDDYDDELLWLARDLGVRLLPAFDASSTGIPHPRVNLRHGVPKGWRTDTCTAGAGSMLIEFGVLSRLTKDPIFEVVARRATMAIWERRDNTTGLLGSTIDAKTGMWIDKTASMGAGVDSYYEYLFKAFILFGDHTYYDMFEAGLTAVGNKMWAGNPPVFRNVNMETGDVANWWVDSLQAYASGMLSEAGMLDAAVEHHAFYYGLWLKYGVLPERFNLQLKVPEVKFYPLRPEFAESTYYLHRATKDPFYRDVGRQIMCDIQKNTKAKCGYGTVHDVTTSPMELEDRMESYFLSETMKYLFLLFDDDNAFTRSNVEYIFTTEGHIIPMLPEFRQPVILEGDEDAHAEAEVDAAAERQIVAQVLLDGELAHVEKETKAEVKRLEGMIANSKKDGPDRLSELTEMIEEVHRKAEDRAAHIKDRIGTVESGRGRAGTGFNAEKQPQRVGQPICHGIPSLRRFYHPVTNLHEIMNSVGVDMKTRTNAGLPPLPPPPPPPPLKPPPLKPPRSTNHSAGNSRRSRLSSARSPSPRIATPPPLKLQEPKRRRSPRISERKLQTWSPPPRTPPRASRSSAPPPRLPPNRRRLRWTRSGRR